MSIAQAAKRIIRRIRAGDIVTARLKFDNNGEFRVLESWLQIGGTLSENPIKTIQAMLDEGELLLQEKLPQQEGTEGYLWKLCLAENAPQTHQDEAEGPLPSEEIHQDLFSPSEKPLCQACKQREAKDVYQGYLVCSHPACYSALDLKAALKKTEQAEYQDYLKTQRAKYQAIERVGQETFWTMLENLVKGERALSVSQGLQEQAKKRRGENA